MNSSFNWASVHADLLSTGFLAVGVLASVQFAVWILSRNQPLELQRFWRLTLRHVGAVSFLLGLGLIWKSELRAVVLALGAATVGFLVAFREIWMSLIAFWMRIVKRHYSLGDFIEIDGIRGRVVDLTWQHTVLAETGPGKDSLTYSGRVVQVPNNRMLLSSLFVENLTGNNWSAHTVQIPLVSGSDILEADKALTKVAESVCAEFYEEALKHMTDCAVKHYLASWP